MKRIIAVGIGMLMVLGLLPHALWAWCWIRDADLEECRTAGTYVEPCCDEYLVRWPGAGMTYYISTSTDSTLITSIQNGMNRWNNVDMSNFTFTDGGTSPNANYANDGVNLINIDSDFCIHNPGSCGQGLLGFSGTWTTGSGASIEAVESDIVLNGEEYTWGDGTGDTIDTEAVIAHEAGHSAGLSHAGATCREAASAGCGPEVPAATMYFALDAGISTDKATLELDDAAALVYGYPRSTFRVQVEDENGTALNGIEVELLDSAAPVNGTNSSEGGNVYGDVTNSAVLFGDGAASNSYVAASPFNATDSQGYTNYVNPVTRNIRVQVTDAACNVTGTQSFSVADGTSTLPVTLTLTGQDHRGPVLAVTSHVNNQAVNTTPITLQGTATDASGTAQCENGVQQVTVNGIRADNDTAVGSDTANWSADVNLTQQGNNSFTIVATDDSANHNTTTVNLNIIYDTTPPTVAQVSPADGATDALLSDVISVKFSEAMDASTITAATFTVDNGVTGTIAYDSVTHTATLTPSSPLSVVTTYTVTLTTGITDAAGNHLDSSYGWSFTTVDDALPPTVTQVYPTNGTVNNGTSIVIWARFSEAIFSASLTSSTFSLNNGVTGTIVYNSSTYTATFYPDHALSFNTTYTATLSTGVRDLAGNGLTGPYSWSFTTASPSSSTGGSHNSSSGGGCFIGQLGSLWQPVRKGGFSR